MYIVNVRVAEHRLCIGQQKVEDKSIAITALPLLIEEPDIRDAVVSIDATGYRHSIAGQITSKGCHCLLSLKENRQELYDDAVCGFKACSAEDISEEWEYDHGRYETRKCSILKSREVLLPENQQLWSNLKTLIKIESTRLIKDRQMRETRYYISGEEGFNLAYFNALVGGLRIICIRYPDVTSKEDDSRARSRAVKLSGWSI